MVRPLTVAKTAGKIEISGSFGVFLPGELRIFMYDAEGTEKNEMLLQAVRPQDAIDLHQTIAITPDIARISLHLIDTSGLDRGALGEVSITAGDEQR